MESIANGGTPMQVNVLEAMPISPQIFRDEIQSTGASLLPTDDVHAIATTTFHLDTSRVVDSAP